MSNKKGVTLIELIMVLFIAANLFLIVFLIYDVGFQVFQQGEKRSGLRSDVGRAVSLLTKDVRLASGFTVANENSVTFWTDYNGDEEESVGESITYSFSGISGEALIKTDANGDYAVLDEVVEFTLSYDSILVDSIHLISFVLDAAKDFETFKIESSIKARNII